jgi:hypothetical protein
VTRTGIADHRLDALDHRIPAAIGGDVDVAGILMDVAAVPRKTVFENVAGRASIVEFNS